ncbi:MAG: hypothetical protein AAF721_38255 [Myxococcota bacterium]
MRATGLWVMLGMLLEMASACGSAPAEAEACPECTTTDASDESGDGATATTAVDPSDDGEGSGESGDGSDDGDPEPPAAGGLPCEVRDALAAECFGCHDDAPAFGAPMSLASYADLHVPAPSDATTPTHAMVEIRLQDPDRPMPPDGIIDADAKQTILDWIAAGTPEHIGVCDDPDPVEEPTVGPDALPCDVTAEFTAHAPGSDDGFVIPEQGAGDMYQCFATASPFGEGEQGTAWAPIVDDERVLHHWILYREDSGEHADGDVFPCDVSLQLSAQFVAGWAPGGENYTLPESVGLDLGGPDSVYILQVHYNNSAEYPDAIDKSGVAFCTTPTPRPQMAGTITTGSVWLDIPPNAEDHEEKGYCSWLYTVGWDAPIHIIANNPHMHEFGRAAFAEVQHSDGTVESITHVETFTFENQRQYHNDPEVIVQPGELITTTCVFDNPTSETVHFGEGTGDEMCFDFLLAYPIEAVTNRDCGILL